jgi:toxin-antitoxin system PIN domain toxin
LTSVDTNILVYAHLKDHPKHKPALMRLTALAECREHWALPVFCVGEFLRIVTHPRLFSNPYSPREACAALARLLEAPNLVVLLPGDGFLPLLVEAVEEVHATGNLIFDAQIVALCREGGVRTLLTEDRDFDRFRNFATTGLTAGV